MSLMCSYQNCLCAKYPFSSMAFFRLPNDSRRSVWIKNSGNKSLTNIGPKAHRFFCENHFRQCDIRSQFNRKILRKYAVPVEYKPKEVTSEFNPEPVPHCAILNKDECDNETEDEERNLVIEKLQDEHNTTDFYEEVEMNEVENLGKDNATDENIENTYTLLDFYLQPDECDVSELQEEITSKDEAVEIYYEETSNNQADSSTPALHSDADLGKSLEELEEEPEVSDNKSKPNEVMLETSTNETAQVTTSSNEYQEDRHFALSLVGYFQRLPNGKKALAKLKILQYLTELEMGLTGNL